MGVNGVLVLDEVRDVERLIGSMTIPNPSVHYQIKVPALDGLVFSVRPDSYYKNEPDSRFGFGSYRGPIPAKPDRVFVNLLSYYWYPGESHYSSGNWNMVSTVCQMVWDIEPSIVVHYMPEPFDDSLFEEADSDEIVKDAHLLTPERVAELDDAARAGAGC